MNKNNVLLKMATRASQSTIVRSIRNGLVNMIPVIIIGAFALILKEFPVAAYKEFINTFADGFIYNFFAFINNATFGMLSVYMTFSISRAFMKIKADSAIVHSGAIFSSLIAFFILTGSVAEGFVVGNLGPKSMLIAIASGLGASALYLKLYQVLNSGKTRLLTRGADRNLNNALTTLFPILIVAGVFALFDTIVVRIFDKDSFHDLYQALLNGMFSRGETGFFKGFFFVFLSSLLWFFGVHGSDALEGVMQTFFATGLAHNQELVAAGLAPDAVLTKEFFDCFVLMGGCGATICLLIAILIFSKNRASKGLGLTATFPMVFNINELMVFGLPIIFNPIMLIPFLLVPLACYSIAYLAIATGIVPMIVNEVAWTTPVLIGGYYATGSIAGSLLQLFNIAVGVAIYFPFIKLLDRQSLKITENNYNEFVTFYKENEQSLQYEKLINLNNVYGDFAKELSAEVRYDLRTNMNIYYQGQYDYDGKCVGVEALMRWHHPIFGNIYPPLVVKLVTECGLLTELEEAIFERVLEEREEVLRKYGEGIKISVNITGTTIVKEEFLSMLEKKNEEYGFEGKNICIEVTEKEDLPLTDVNVEILRRVRAMGLGLAIDDFSMGQTSINYLKYNLFTVIKIDGTLVQGLSTSSSKNCQEIISSIAELASSLSMMVIAEFIQNNEEKDILHDIGIKYYQGYLFSEPTPLKKVE